MKWLPLSGKRKRTTPTGEISAANDDSGFVISVHIPKTAGTSFAEMLETAMPGGVIYSYNNERMDPMLGRFLARPRLKDHEKDEVAAYCRENAVKCIHGHFWISRYYGLFPDAAYITFLRDPIDRMVSEYYFQIHNDKIKHTREGSLARDNKLTFEDYLRTLAERNVYAQYGIGKYFDEFTVIGLMERFAESVALLGQHIPALEGCGIRFRNRGRNPGESRGVIDSSLRQELAELASEDYRIYREARRKLDLDIAGIGVR